jgi:hypothetical protein
VAVHLHPAGQDKLLGMTARGDPCAGQDALQPHRAGERVVHTVMMPCRRIALVPGLLVLSQRLADE